MYNRHDGNFARGYVRPNTRALGDYTLPVLTMFRIRRPRTYYSEEEAVSRRPLHNGFAFTYIGRNSHFGPAYGCQKLVGQKLS